jgi:hypothetical protein
MFGLKVPTGADVIAEVRFTLTRGGPFVAWDGSPEATDADVTGDLLASRNVVAYLWAAVDKGKLQADEMGFVSVPARIVALQDGKPFFDEKVAIGLTLPARPRTVRARWRALPAPSPRWSRRSCCARCGRTIPPSPARAAAWRPWSSRCGSMPPAR